MWISRYIKYVDDNRVFDLDKTKSISNFMSILDNGIVLGNCLRKYIFSFHYVVKIYDLKDGWK